MTITEKPENHVLKLNERHVKAGIEIRYDDHGVGLYRLGGLLRWDGIVAYWTGPVTIKEMVEFADHALDCARAEEHNKTLLKGELC